MRTFESATTADSELQFSDSSQLDLESPATSDRRRLERSDEFEDRRRRRDDADSSLSGPDATPSPDTVAPRSACTSGRPGSGVNAGRSSGVDAGRSSEVGGVGTAAGRKVGIAACFVSTQSRGCRSSVTDVTSRRHLSSDSVSSSSSSSSSTSLSGTITRGSVPDGYSRVARSVRHGVETSDVEAQRLIANCRQLADSQFYVAELSSTDARRRLRAASPGKFLVRDSAHPGHLYSLTVRTPRGVTSIRTVYDVDGFRLDSETEQARWMTSFESVVSLVNHYVDESSRTSSDGRAARSSCVFVDGSGRRDMPVVLSTPYRARPASLRHLCRLTINVALDGRAVDRLCIVPSLRSYLQQHPFRV